MRVRLVAASVTALMLTCACVTTDGSSEVPSAAAGGREASTLADRLDGIFAAYGEGSRPGFAIGVVRDGQLVVARGYGMADLDSGRPITPDTTFNIASLSKQLTAAATARDIVDGKLALEDPLSEHWEGLPAFMAPIRLEHLVYMTSGLPEYYTLESPRGGWSAADGFTVDDAIGAVLASNRLEYAPGTSWSYSNINYQLLAETAARLNGAPFAELMRARVFEPAGMSTARVDAPLAPRATDATAYARGPAGPTDWHVVERLSPHYGGSGVFASLRDLAAWDRALYVDKAFGEPFTELMLSTRRFDHDKDNDAFGLAYGSYRELPVLWYEGGDAGVSSYMARLTSRGETVICLSNFADGRCSEKARFVVDALLAFES